MHGKMGFLRIAGVAMLAAAMGGLAGCGGGGTRHIVVADEENSRVVISNRPFTTDEAASVVLGQPDFVSDSQNQGLAAPAANTLRFPFGVSQVTAGKARGQLIVADSGNCRVVAFKPPFINNESATGVIGEPDLVTANCFSGATATASSLDEPVAAVTDHTGNLWVADLSVADSRVLMYPTPLSDGEAATVALGQAALAPSAGCDQGLGAPTAATLCQPSYVAFDAKGDAWVSDPGNDRVLEFVPPFTTGMSATLVLGQAGFVSFATGDTASTLDSPLAAVFDGRGDLWVTDTGNSRVLEFVPPFATGMSATLVLGQTKVDGTGTVGCNQGLAAPTAATLCEPFALNFESNGRLVVTDTANQRALTFVPPFTTGMSATIVQGQPDFVSNSINQGLAAPTAKTLFDPIGVAAIR